MSETKACTVGHPMPHDVVHALNGKLLDALAVFQSAREQVGVMDCVDNPEDAGAIHSASSRAVSLLTVADKLLKEVVDDMAAYV